LIAIVFATGFDAMTGALLASDSQGSQWPEPERKNAADASQLSRPDGFSFPQFSS